MKLNESNRERYPKIDATGMTRFTRSVLVLVGAMIVLSTLGGCARDNPKDRENGTAPGGAEPTATVGENSDAVITIAHADWSSEIASAHLFQAVLQELLGYQVELRETTPEEMWRTVAAGEVDILTGAWLPTTHGGYEREYGDRLVDLGPNLTGARIGLVVPTTIPGRQTGDSGKTGRDLVTIRSIEEMSDNADAFAGRIIGIEAGAGVVARTREVLDAYGLRSEFRLVESNEDAMIDRVGEAIYRDHWIVFTGWTPHWIFERYDLAFLDDPKGIYGGEESIHTMVREGFREDEPKAFAVLDRITYTPEQLERLMRWIHEDETDDRYGQAIRWIDAHKETVDRWIEY